MTDAPKQPFRVVIHGSFRKHFSEIKAAYDLFTKAGIEVLAPSATEIVGYKDGFALFAGEEDVDPRMIEILYLHNLKKLGKGGFSFFVNPEGYIGKSASYELGIAHATNVPCFFTNALDDHPAYFHQNSIWSAELLTEYIQTYGELPDPKIARNEEAIHDLWMELVVPGSVVATGGIIEYTHDDPKKEKEILLVKTHKWGGRFSMVGGKVRRNETLVDALKREVMEETGLEGKIGSHVTTFDQIKNSGYYQAGTQHIFVDNVFEARCKHVTLNDEAQEYIWMPVKQALRELPIEPNARHAVELYAALQR
jgi:ADP-ribose pyrophosphatase YjhB (NUDIX family)